MTASFEDKQGLSKFSLQNCMIITYFKRILKTRSKFLSLKNTQLAAGNMF